MFPAGNRRSDVKFESGILIILLIAGLFTVIPYGLYGGSITAFPGNQVITGLGDSSFRGSAAGGRGNGNRTPDCRSCAQRNRL